ncbi:MAG: hypothetical protein AAGI63_17780 [Planctomycetota bacterium]
MNFLCHALPYMDEPLVAVATGIPDWLSLVDRRIRARAKAAKPHLQSDDAMLRAVARGVVQHVEDDRWFHATRAFAEVNLQLAVQLRDLLPGDAGFRPTFVGHILVEMLLDSFWVRDDRNLCDQYYDAVATVPSEDVQRCVNVITGNPTDGLVAVMERFSEMQFLYDYTDRSRLLFRVNQVLRRVRLPPLPETLLEWLPDAEKLVESRRRELLAGPEDGQSRPYPFPGDPDSE